MEKIKDSEMGSFLFWGGEIFVWEYGVAILKITFVYFWPGIGSVGFGLGWYSKQPPDHVHKSPKPRPRLPQANTITTICKK